MIGNGSSLQNQFLKESEERNTELKAALEEAAAERRKDVERKEELVAEVEGLKEHLADTEKR